MLLCGINPTDSDGRSDTSIFRKPSLRGLEVKLYPYGKCWCLAVLSASIRLKKTSKTTVVVIYQIKDKAAVCQVRKDLVDAEVEVSSLGRIRHLIQTQGPHICRPNLRILLWTTEEESPDELMAEPEVLPEPWTLFTDGSSCVDGSGAGLILTNPEGAEFTYAMRFRFEATNNEAEYEALIAGLWIAEKVGIKNLQANVDS
ncbi:reverse transcriptase domain-containing protein [Tanacetum coccineum]